MTAVAVAGIPDLGAVMSLITGIVRLFTDPGGFFSDAAHWLSQTLFPPELQTWFLGTLGYPQAGAAGQWATGDVYQTMYQVMQSPALLVAAAAGGLRILRGLADQRTDSLHAMLDVLPRFLLCAALIGIPGTGVSLGYIVIVWGINTSVAVATGLFTTLLHGSLLQGTGISGDWFGQLLQGLGNQGHASTVAIIGFIPLLIMFLYAAFLLVLRTIMLGFCVATAPLCVATVAFDARNRFFQFWIDLFSGAVLTPIVLAGAIAVSFTVASSVVGALAIGPVLAIVVLLGGIWMSGKLVHQLTWRHFSHGGVLAGFAAGVGAMLGPVQRLASAGFLAEALGANRGGGNRAIELMKRVGVAAQGYHPGTVAAPQLLTVPLRTRAPGPAVTASNGPPAVHQALGAAGQQVVGDMAGRFDSDAFTAFASGHGPLIGELTRDQPYGSIAFGDRAKLAWERVSSRSRARFANDYLSHWLGADGAADLTVVADPAGEAAVPA